MPLHEAAMAALNNAEWCAAVWRSHGLTVEKAHGLWFSTGRVPQYYPNVVTTDVTADATRQAAFIDGLKRDANAVGFSVKDSFARLDLDALDMSVIIAGQWLVCPRASMARTGTVTLDWETIKDPQGLADWERAWRGDDENQARIFLPPLLNDRRTIMLGGRNRDGVIVAGGIAFEAAGLLGITNVFGERREYVATLASLRPDASLVCYESGEDLTIALRDGFEVSGPLHIWKSA